MTGKRTQNETDSVIFFAKSVGSLNYTKLHSEKGGGVLESRISSPYPGANPRRPPPRMKGSTVFETRLRVIVNYLYRTTVGSRF